MNLSLIQTILLAITAAIGIISILVLSIKGMVWAWQKLTKR